MCVIRSARTAIAPTPEKVPACKTKARARAPGRTPTHLPGKCVFQCDFSARLTEPCVYCATASMYVISDTRGRFDFSREWDGKIWAIYGLFRYCQMIVFFWKTNSPRRFDFRCISVNARSLVFCSTLSSWQEIDPSPYCYPILLFSTRCKLPLFCNFRLLSPPSARVYLQAYSNIVLFGDHVSLYLYFDIADRTFRHCSLFYFTIRNHLHAMRVNCFVC